MTDGKWLFVNFLEKYGNISAIDFKSPRVLSFEHPCSKPNNNHIEVKNRLQIGRIAWKDFGERILKKEMALYFYPSTLIPRQIQNVWYYRIIRRSFFEVVIKLVRIRTTFSSFLNTILNLFNTTEDYDYDAKKRDILKLLFKYSTESKTEEENMNGRDCTSRSCNIFRSLSPMRLRVVFGATASNRFLASFFRARNDVPYIFNSALRERHRLASPRLHHKQWPALALSSITLGPLANQRIAGFTNLIRLPLSHILQFLVLRSTWLLDFQRFKIKT